MAAGNVRSHVVLLLPYGWRAKCLCYLGPLTECAKSLLFVQPQVHAHLRSRAHLASSTGEWNPRAALVSCAPLMDCGERPSMSQVPPRSQCTTLPPSCQGSTCYVLCVCSPCSHIETPSSTLGVVIITDIFGLSLRRFCGM